MNTSNANQSAPLAALVDLVARLRNAISPIIEPPARTVLIIQPPAMPSVIPPTGGFYIGKNSSTGAAVVALPAELDRHLLIIGGTGCGKTTLIARLFTEEILKWQ